jgi:hypothetical protein
MLARVLRLLRDVVKGSAATSHFPSRPSDWRPLPADTPVQSGALDGDVDQFLLSGVHFF